ncbi:MAG: hypothetical protein JWP75_1395 [Frondihabitans sp.]|nr:hypothetical protein [Frondihabitans sp.]
MKGWLRRVAAFAVPVALIAGALTVATTVVSSETQSASAASTAGFDAGQIITDQTFYDTGTMTAASIQSFLNGKVATCASGYTCLKSYSQTTTTRAADAYCKAYTGASSESAATIVYRVGQACGINPQVLLTTLQKEEGLVTSTSPSTSAYTIAMGFGCPDTSACDTTYYGFFNQVYSAAHQFQVYAKNPTYFRYRAGFNNVIQYSPDTSCGSKTVYIENQATASLYNYTPYTPNAAALAAGYGSAPCGAYGNRNFYLYFSDWFGSPNGLLESASFEGGSATGWTPAGGLHRAVVNNASVAQNGSYYLTANTGVAGASLYQTVTRSSTTSEAMTASIWLRSASGTSTGSLTAWGLGGTTESKSQTFTVGTTWTQVTVALPFNVAHSSARMQVTLGTLGASLYMDNAALTFATAPPKQNLLINGSFDSGIAPWDGGNGAMNKATSSDPRFVMDGPTFGAANTLVPGRSLAQAIPITPVTNQQYTFTIYLRTSDSVNPFRGTLALWALGGTSNVVATKTFSAVHSGWTKVQTTVNTGTSGATRLKAEVYLGTLKSTLWLDKGSVSPNRLTQGSFETGTAPWNHGTGVKWATYKGTGLPDGTAFLQTNAATAGTSITQDLTLQPLIGSTYTASIWVKNGSTTAATGRLALWSFGAVSSAASQSFTTTGTWTLVQVTIPISTTDITGLRIEVYEDSVGINMNLDSALLY